MNFTVTFWRNDKNGNEMNISETGLTRRGIEWNLSKLKAKGLIERNGSPKGGYWKVTEQIEI